MSEELETPSGEWSASGADFVVDFGDPLFDCSYGADENRLVCRSQGEGEIGFDRVTNPDYSR